MPDLAPIRTVSTARTTTRRPRTRHTLLLYTPGRRGRRFLLRAHRPGRARLLPISTRRRRLTRRHCSVGRGYRLASRNRRGGLALRALTRGAPDRLIRLRRTLRGCTSRRFCLATQLTGPAPTINGPTSLPGAAGLDRLPRLGTISRHATLS
jgi:hypothetical protein